MFGRWLRGETAPQSSGADALRRSLAEQLPGADAETISVVTSMAEIQVVRGNQVVDRHGPYKLRC